MTTKQTRGKKEKSYISARIPSSLKEQVEVIAIDIDLSVTWITIQALKKYVEEHHKEKAA